MKFNYIENDKITERGNVLFLILIAVALFAALSYAVTQSSRSGGGTVDKETTLIRSSQLTQYPSSVRTSIIRMTLAGIDDTSLLFNSPTDFGAGKPIDTPAEEKRAVFHTNGGGASYTLAPAEIMANQTATRWIYNAELQIESIGLTDVGSGNGNDIVAYLVGINESMCEQLNDRYGIIVTSINDPDGDGVPNVTGLNSTDLTNYMDDTYTFPTTDGNKISSDFVGQPFGCFEEGTSNTYVYYHVLVER